MGKSGGNPVIRNMPVQYFKEGKGKGRVPKWGKRRRPGRKRKASEQGKKRGGKNMGGAYVLKGVIRGGVTSKGEKKGYVTPPEHDAESRQRIHPPEEIDGAKREENNLQKERKGGRGWCLGKVSKN